MSMRVCLRNRILRLRVRYPINHPLSWWISKGLWVCRLARLDLACAISTLATQVTRRSRNSDKQLFRFVSYLHSTKNLCLMPTACDPPELCSLDLYCDADLGGCPYTAKSKSGLFLVVQGPGGTFFPFCTGDQEDNNMWRVPPRTLNLIHYLKAFMKSSCPFTSC